MRSLLPGGTGRTRIDRPYSRRAPSARPLKGLEVILYFDEDLARNSTLDADHVDFQIVPVQARPFMPLVVFLQVMAERDPEFARRMRDESPVVEVLETGTIDHYSGCVLCTRPYVKGLLL